jgi:mRNA-degrading endonuclease RelE of RelBE toxin-antitoxin system
MKVILSPSFEKSLNKLSDAAVKRIYNKINNLAAEEGNLNIKKLKTGDDYRLRVGNYRVIFEYNSINDEVVILLQNVFHRKDAYKKR